VIVRATAEVDGALGRVDFYVNGQYMATDTMAPYRFEWNSAAMPTGQYTLVAKAYELQNGTEAVSSTVTVTTTCQQPAVQQQPSNVALCRDRSLGVSVSASGTATLVYQWRKGGQVINPAANPSAATPTLIVSSVVIADAGNYDCIITNACGTATSTTAIVTVQSCVCSIADLVGGDGNPPADASVDGNDFQAFLNAFGGGTALADIVGGDGNPPADGSVDGNDFQAFLNAFAAGC